MAQKELNPIERKLIKGLSDFDLINDLIGGVKLVGSGIWLKKKIQIFIHFISLGVQKIRDQEKKSKKDKKAKE